MVKSSLSYMYEICTKFVRNITSVISVMDVAIHWAQFFLFILINYFRVYGESDYDAKVAGGWNRGRQVVGVL